MLEKPRSDEVRSRPRGLAKLSGLEADEEKVALYLRELHARLEMTSKELAPALTELKPGEPVSEFQLSRCLSGKTLPKLSLISRMHELLAGRTGRPVDEGAVRVGRELVFAAAQSKGPLMAREYRLEAALEDLGEQRARTAEELAGLRGGLNEERRRLASLEQELRDMSEHAYRERREVAEEQEEIRQRIAVLEDLVRQHEALLRLMRQEDEHVTTMMAAAGKEIEGWRSGEAVAAGSEGVQGEAASPQRSADEVFVLREQGSNEAADRQIRAFVDVASLSDLVELYAIFEKHRRLLETRRLATAIVKQRPARDVLRLATGMVGKLPQFEDGRLLQAAGDQAPVAEVLLLADLLRETTQTHRLTDLTSGLTSGITTRPHGEVEYLRSAGLPFRTPNPTIPAPEPEKRRFWSR
ncbi:hypothetical protein ACFVZH_25875 [Streptomyces sp. NPDC059534]|uniref:hypothetical protein n=1 Tax=Streptomyces sp. NPDC059534 TaxID=3346859 RepID=UPI00367C4396